MPGTRITDEDRKKIDKKFICTICNLLLCMPVQTHCGHLMCLTCLQTLLESSDARCPEDGTELKKDQAFPDVFTKRELKGLCLYCPNPGCPWHGTYEQLEEHSTICEHAEISCVHPQCKMNFKRSHLAKHLQNQCECRNVKCNYCGKDVTFASIKAHVETNCEEAIVTCPYCKETIVRRNIERHERVSCVDYEMPCQYAGIGCNKTIKRKDFLQHLKDALIYHGNLLMSYIDNFLAAQHWNRAQDRRRAQFSEASQDLGSRFQDDERARIEKILTTPRTLIRDFIAKCQRLQEKIMSLKLEFTRIKQKISDEVTEVRSGLAEKFVMVVGKLTGLERRIENLETSGGGDSRARNEVHELKGKVRDLTVEIGNLRERNMSLEREMRDKMSIIDRLRSRMDQVDESLALNTVKITDMESQRAPRAQQTIRSYNGTLLWKIDGYQRKRQDAIDGVKTALYSHPFYSAQFGYKMCAKIYMNGDGFGKGSHLSLFFVVMRGDYDALQTWPFQKKITMMLLDQGNGDHMIDAFHSDPQSSSFQRPKSDMNIASGSPLFMPLDSVNNRQYIKDDVMFVKIIVD